MVSTLKLTKIQIPNSDSDVISLDASTGNITLNKNLGGTSITVQGENTATTNLQQGLAKAFLSYKGTSTNSIYNSNNITSVTDHGTGDQSPNYTNNFNSGTDYACSAFGQEDTGGGGRIMAGKGTPGTGDRRVTTVNTSNAVKDLLYFNITYHGDLA